MVDLYLCGEIFFGPEVRIIGIDFNPLAKRWEGDGFEIHIGSQRDPKFWANFYNKVGMVDILLDDGGHTNEQKRVTTHQSIPFIRDGGLLIVEDVNASYFKDFGNPSKYSFINYAKLFIDGINVRFTGVEVVKNMFRDAVYSAHFYDSIVAFRVDRPKCFVSSWTSNQGQTFEAEDYRHHDSIARRTNQALIGIFKKIGIKLSMGKLLNRIEAPYKRHKLRKYFN